MGYVESRPDFFKKAEVICHTYTNIVWEKCFEFLNVKETSLWFNETGNLASSSFPWIVADKYGGKIP